ncbi:TonB-dependent receptor [Chitinivorax sp. PXF-14]|uniref:TonB-dependent receptor plug domain-containing protein n=1 Tax=Chitinivorax sp. PXF-14 TaxID=3230488 RepID=UPI003465C8A8
MPFRPTTLFACLLLGWLGTATAAESDEEDLALAFGDTASISLATGSKQTLRRAPAVASVITADEIKAMGATDLDEVLETVPGMHVTRTPVVWQPIYVMRGIASSPTNPQILMLQNGVPMTTLYTGDKGNMWGGLPLDNIARIEIIRGPGSALYGADAYAGVINIITKTAADIDGTEFGVRDGAFRTRDVWLQHGGQLGPVAMAGYLRWGKTDGEHETIEADAQTGRDKVFGTHASLAPGPVSTGRDALDAGLDLSLDKWRLRAGYKLRDKLQTGAGVASSLDPDSYGKSQRITSDLSWADPQLANDWGAGATLSYLSWMERTDDTNLMLSPPGSRFPLGSFPDGFIGGPNRWERQLRLSGFTTYTGFAGHSIRLGAGHDDLNLYKTTTNKNNLLTPRGPQPTGPVIEYSDIQPHITPHRRKNDYAYLQDEWQLARDWAVTAGLRHDRYSDFGGTTNPRAALVWDASLNLTAKLLYGKAFRAPAFIEAYGINPVNSGNPGLKPESIQTRELALAWQARKNLQLSLNLFRYDMKDVIRVVANPVAGTGGTYQNIGAQRGHGGELEAGWDVDSRLRVSANYAYQRSVDIGTGLDAGYAPHSHYYARADWHFLDNWLLSAQGNRIVERKRIAGDPRTAVPDYTTADLTLRAQVTKQLEVSASGRNLFDATVFEPTPPGTIPGDLPMPGRAWYVQAVYKL